MPGSPIEAKYSQNITVADVEYFVGAFHWGELTAEEAMDSLQLFVDEVMPSFGG